MSHIFFYFFTELNRAQFPFTYVVFEISTTVFDHLLNKIPAVSLIFIEKKAISVHVKKHF